LRQRFACGTGSGTQIRAGEDHAPVRGLEPIRAAVSIGDGFGIHRRAVSYLRNCYASLDTERMRSPSQTPPSFFSGIPRAKFSKRFRQLEILWRIADYATDKF